MANTITAPYNFVPLNTHVYLPNWGADGGAIVTQDIPFEDGEDGWIELTWTNVSPMFIGGDKQDSYSIHVLENGARRFFIPGSSIKGMLRNVLNILCYGKMIQYDNRSFGYRDFDTRTPDGRDYIGKMSKVQFGWLRKVSDCEYRIAPCKGNYRTIPITAVRAEFPNYGKGKSVWEVNQNVGKNMFPELKKERGYRLFCTGKMKRKKYELLIPMATFQEEEIDKDIINSFLTVYSTTPGFENYVAMLNDKKTIPVSFVRGEKQDMNKIIAIGMGRMFRYPYKKNIKMLVEDDETRGQSPSQYQGKLDLCETMFGVIGERNSIKGRVQFGNAFATNAISSKLPEIIALLSSPKPSYYPLYLHQEGVEYKTYENADCIAGRKVYRTRIGSTPSDDLLCDKATNSTKKIRPIPANQDFKMRINVHNLKPIEIGALLCAITLNHTEGVYHHIGLGKAYGYGKLAFKGLTLHHFRYTEQEYLQTFEKEMTDFYNKKYCSSGSNSWRTSLPIKILIAILSDHDADQLKVMNFNGFKDGKGSFSQLHEDFPEGIKSSK